jgi:hypothetical protein
MAKHEPRPLAERTSIRCPSKSAACQGEADLLEGVPLPRHVEIRVLAAEDIAVVLRRLGLVAVGIAVRGHLRPGHGPWPESGARPGAAGGRAAR